MTDAVVQVAQYLSDNSEYEMGEQMFYYQMPSEVNECTVVQRVRSNRTVPAVIDAGIHSLRIATRANSSTRAYEIAKELYDLLSAKVDETVSDEPGFIRLDETVANITMYDEPQFFEQDQQSRKTFEFYVLLITKS